MTHILWLDLQYSWPLLRTSDSELFPSPSAVIELWRLPLIDTVLLVTSNFTVTSAHHALKKDKCGLLKARLMLTMLPGTAFLVLQAEGYVYVYNGLGLTLGAGIYGSTLFMFTGFHGVRVTLGALVFGIMLVRILRGHLDTKHHFGFEVASWYWHFVDVVWIDLFIFAYMI